MGQLSAKDWTLLTIAFARARPLSPVQLQKTLFLLGQRLAAEVGPHFYVFEPYNYGPFSKQVYVDAEDLETAGLVTLVAHPGGDWHDYAPTPEGTKKASELAKAAPRKAVNYLPKLVKWTADQSFPELVRWIYANYPEFKVNSVFVD